MIAVLKHELRLYFHSLTAYVFGAFLLAVVGIGAMLYNIQAAVSNFEFVLSFGSLVFVVIVPILTMRVIAEERKQKTDQLLYSLPITTFQVIMGKYLALLAMFAVPVAIFSLYPLIMLMLGGVDLVASYAGILGYFFMGAACIAVCMYLSTLTENQIIAALSGFGVLLVSYLLPSIQTLFTTGSGLAMAAFVVILLAVSLIVGLRSRSLTLGAGVFVVGFVLLTILFNTRSAVLTSAFTSVLGALALFEPFLEFVNGLFSVTALVYYLGVIVLFLFLTGQALEKRRWN